MVNWTIQGIVNLISAGIFGIAFYIALRMYSRSKFKYQLYLALMWFCFVLWALFAALSYIFLYYFISITLFQVCLYTSLLGLFFGIITIDSARETVDPLKLSIFSLFSGVYIFISLDRNSYYFHTFPNGEVGIMPTTNLEIASIFPMALLFILFILL